MSDFDEQAKSKEVELLKNSIDHLKSVHQKLEASAKAAKERREKIQKISAPPKTVSSPRVETNSQIKAEPETAITDSLEKNEPSLTSTQTPIDTVEIEAVVDAIKLSESEMPKEEFHGLHSK